MMANAELLVPLEDCADELDFLWLQRECACGAPNNDLHSIGELDEALAAQIDLIRLCSRDIGAIRVAKLDSTTASFCLDWVDGLIIPSPTVEPYALARFLSWLPEVDRRDVRLEHSLAVHLALELRRATQRDCELLLEADSSLQREVAWLAAGHCGLRAMLARCVEGLHHPSRRQALPAAEAATLLGDRADALERLLAIAQTSAGATRRRALDMVVLASSAADAVAALRAVSLLADQQRECVCSFGLVGDPKYIPWLLDKMIQPSVARVAFESFVHITGADVNLDQLEAMPPDDFADGPSDDPDDDDVELPEDVALPWPNVERVKAWWMEHRGEFTPGRKLFLGKPITPEHCVHVLKTGFQRQRVIAAHYRCLIQPGTMLFPTSAPARRQQKLLAAM
jgi:hypothetical protein